jgi:hypothetical protein
VCAFAINTSPELRANVRGRWPVGQNILRLFGDTIAASNRVYFIVLASGLSKQAATTGQRALFDTFGLTRDGGLFINERMN